MCKKFIKLVSVIMAAVMLLVCAPVADMGAFTASAATKTGSLGGNVKWTYDSKTKVINVTGSGNMKNFSSANDGQGFNKLVIGSAQYPNKDATRIVIGEGITNIGKNAFRSLTGVKSVSIPSTVTSIGQSAFEGCSALTTVNLTEHITSIGAYAFKNTKFASVNMPYSVKSIGNEAFAGVSGLKISCNYGDAAYNYCVGASAAYSIRKPSLIAEPAADDPMTIVLKIKDGSGLNAGNFTLTYNSAVVTPVSTENGTTENGNVTTAVVYNEPGRISVAVMADSTVPYSVCGDKCAYTVASIAFRAVNGEADDTDVIFTSEVMLHLDKRVSAASAAGTVSTHNYVFASEIPATCKAEGKKIYACKDCGKTREEVTQKNPLNHDGGTTIADAAEPTCVDTGYTGNTVCKGCGAILGTGEEIDATGVHTYGDWVVTDPATCLKAGTKTKTCTVCGNAETETLPKTGHDYIAVVTAPTCTQQGYTTYTCSYCSDSYVANKVGVIDHDYNESGVCKVCGDVKVQSISFADGSGLTADNEAKTILALRSISAADLIKAIESEGWTVVGADGSNMADTALVGTCCKVTNASGLTYTFILKGDVNGDGKVNTTDARTALRVSARLENLDSAYFTAADLDGNGKIVTNEARTILRVSARLEAF